MIHSLSFWLFGKIFTSLSFLKDSFAVIEFLVSRFSFLFVCFFLSTFGVYLLILSWAKIFCGEIHQHPYGCSLIYNFFFILLLSELFLIFAFWLFNHKCLSVSLSGLTYLGFFGFMDLGASPQVWEVFRNYCFKYTLFLYISAFSGISIMQILFLSIMSYKSHSLSSVIYIIFSSEWIISNVLSSRPLIQFSAWLNLLLMLSVETLSSVTVFFSSRIFTWVAF